MVEDNKNLLEHWNSAFYLTEEEKEQIRGEADTGAEDGWKDLAPSEKLLEAAGSLKDCKNVLDVVPPETAEEILKNAARIITSNGRIIIGLNYYMQPENAEKRGFTVRNGNMVYIDGILRLVSRTDEEWTGIFKKYFHVERLDHFAWPGEEKETRRLFYLTVR